MRNEHEHLKSKHRDQLDALVRFFSFVKMKSYLHGIRMMRFERKKHLKKNHKKSTSIILNYMMNGNIYYIL